MPVSICIKCGGRKDQPLQFCPHCGFVPKDHHDQARSILLSDAHRTPIELDAAAHDIRRKQILLFHPAELRPILDRLNRERASRRFLGLRNSTWLIVGAAILAGALAAAMTILIQTR
jgi:hypothetical protein